MFISPTTSTAFHAGKVKLVGFKMDDLSKNFEQVSDVARRNQMDFSILKHGDKRDSNFKDIYTIIVTKDIDKAPYRLNGTTISYINKGTPKDYVSLRLLSAILEAMDKVKEKIGVYNAKKICN